jgi:Membrane-bound lysozyme-inhibitor of c-type lysozyme
MKVQRNVIPLYVQIFTKKMKSKKMKRDKKLLVLTIMGILLFDSCQQNNNFNEESAPMMEEIVRNSVTDAHGTKLYMTFDNDRATATFEFEGKTIKMTQDTMASGVRCTNKQYEFMEHQGNITLKKDGQLVFESNEF